MSRHEHISGRCALAVTIFSAGLSMHSGCGNSMHSILNPLEPLKEQHDNLQSSADQFILIDAGKSIEHPTLGPVQFENASTQKRVVSDSPSIPTTPTISETGQPRNPISKNLQPNEPENPDLSSESQRPGDVVAGRPQAPCESHRIRMPGHKGPGSGFKQSGCKHKDVKSGRGEE